MMLLSRVNSTILKSAKSLEQSSEVFPKFVFQASSESGFTFVDSVRIRGVQPSGSDFNIALECGKGGLQPMDFRAKR